MQQCNDLQIYNQASRMVLSILLRQAALKIEQIVALRLDKVRRWREGIDNEGLTVVASARIVGEPVANLYRWQKDAKVRTRGPRSFKKSKWTAELVQMVKEVREEHPTWGKLKIQKWLEDKGVFVSASTVGRIISDFIKRGIFQAYDHLISGKKQRRKQKCPRHYATRLPKGHKPQGVGEIIQLDTVHVELPDGRKLYHINAICPISRFCWGMAFEDHGAKSASVFLEKILDNAPFKIHAIQTDQGSEFRGEFETAAENRSVKFFYLPPKSPKLNAHVERLNRTWREDFYQMWDFGNHSIEQINRLVDAFADEYNSERYHQSLNMKTPLDYLRTVCNIG